MQAIAWNCKTDKKHEKVTYMLQVDEIKGARAKKNTFKALELRIGEGGQISNVRRPTGRKREERRG